MSTNLQELQNRVTGSAVPVTSSLGAEAERVIAQVQAAYTIAMKYPRDINESLKLVKDICKVLEVAIDAEYTYNRGGKAVTGPNIRIAEIIASQWKNLEYATVEIVRSTGESLCEAYCVDLETNVKARTQFVVPHRRDLSEGGKDLKSDRDIYEMIANMGSRRVREQIFRVIPDFVVQAALEQCRTTVKQADAKEPLKDRISKLVPAFEALQVTRKMLATWLKCQPEEMIEQQFQQLRPIFRSIRDHQARKEDFFDVESSSIPAGAAKKDDAKAADVKPAEKEEKPKDPPAKVKADEKPAPEPEPENDTGAPTLADIMAKLEKATNGDDLEEVRALMAGNPNIGKAEVLQLNKAIKGRLAKLME